MRYVLSLVSLFSFLKRCRVVQAVCWHIGLFPTNESIKMDMYVCAIIAATTPDSPVLHVIFP
jgi:hypothetical protein